MEEKLSQVLLGLSTIYESMIGIRENINAFDKKVENLSNSLNKIITDLELESTRITLTKDRNIAEVKTTYLQIRYKLNTPDSIAPTKATAYSSGYDLYADRMSEKEIERFKKLFPTSSIVFGEDWYEIPPMERIVIPTGLILELPNNYEAQVRPRSGLAFKHGITVLNTPGTIDADYRGLVGVILINLGKDSYIVKVGERIAQLVITKLPEVALVPSIEDLNVTPRGDGGFGHSGKF